VTFLVGYLVASQLNWAFAELVLNDWIAPRLPGFMRTGDDAATGAAIARMSLGFMAPLLVIAILQAAMVRPTSWIVRALSLSMLISLAAYYGTYTFLSGWGTLDWWTMMVVATADAGCMVVGALVIGFLQQWKKIA
jgi:hypothetical protein